MLPRLRRGWEQLMSTRVRSFSKINLGLAVGPVRSDGYHPLTTVYQTLQLHDFVTVTARPSGKTNIVVTSNHRSVPRTEARNADRNTAYRMVAAALNALGVTASVEVAIDKKLPIQGGMGAGSANAAAALVALERELQRALPAPQRLELAAGVGSDVPLFLLGGTVLGLGRGEEVYPLPDSKPVPCVVAIPSVGISTQLAFQQLDERYGGGTGASGRVAPDATLTSEQPVDKLKQLSRALAFVWSTSGVESGPSGIAPIQRSELASDAFSDVSMGKVPSREEDVGGDLAENPLLALVRTGIENDFEEVAFSQHPSLRSTKRELMGSGRESALYAALSGSGSALFGLYRSQADARAAQHRVQQSGTRAILTETLPRRTYWAAMFAE
jgi:4-diphosphocytidyl-2-C-methyl-D-erythritol kinase